MIQTNKKLQDIIAALQVDLWDIFEATYDGSADEYAIKEDLFAISVVEPVCYGIQDCVVEGGLDLTKNKAIAEILNDFYPDEKKLAAVINGEESYPYDYWEIRNMCWEDYCTLPESIQRRFECEDKQRTDYAAQAEYGYY